jgi:uracil-DNA glycosylase
VTPTDALLFPGAYPSPDDSPRSRLGKHLIVSIERTSPTDPVPPGTPLGELRDSSRGCRACGLWRWATQTVFGEGTPGARIMLVGEQPGDREDLAGRPFVGPAGKLLDGALADAGIDRDLVYVTNVVKHFKWERRGKRRIHKKPNTEEILACRPWLDAEIGAVRPSVLVCMGASAAQALLGRTFRVTAQHGRFVESELAPFVTATLHPSAILRAGGDQERDRMLHDLVADLRKVARAASEDR